MTNRTPDHALPGYGDACLCGDYYACRCRPEPDVSAHHEASYQAGYEACLADGYDERPMTEWVYRTGHRCLYRPGPDGRPRPIHAMTALWFAEFTWRRFCRTEAAYRRWFESEYGHDLAEYLAGYDAAGAGLPSAASDPDRHAVCVAVLEGYGEPTPDLHDQPLGSWPAPAETDTDLPF